MSRSLASTLSAALTILGMAFSSALSAQTIPILSRTEKAGKKQVGAILIAGTVAVRLKTSHGGATPAERAKTAAAKLRSRVSKGLSPSSIRSAEEDGQWSVTAGDETLLTVTKREARAQDSDRDTLAHLWAKQIRRLLSTPAL